MREADFTKEYLADLNPLQLAAAKKVKGAVLLLAVPGSGKTTVLIKRLGYMIYAAGVNPRSILTMTYTVAATKEMRARFREYFGDEYADVLEFRTINGVCSKIIEWYSRNISRQAPFSLAESEGSVASLIGGIYRELNDEYAGESIIKDCRTAISYIKNMMLTPEEIGELETNITNLPEIYERYCAFLRSRRLMDYDDQMVYALAILRRYPEVLAHCREKFSYICVDEAQDTSKIQHEIIRLLAGESGNIFMVGDEDQSIYGFRAAYPDALMSFEKDYKNAEVMYLEENYRSSEEIIALASRFVSKNLYRRSKKLVPTQGAGKPVRIIGTQNRQGQFRYLFEVGKSPAGETAILFRNNDSAIPLIDFYERNGIGYNTRAFDGAFFSTRVVNDIRDIISFSFDPKNAEIFMRIYYKLNIKLSKEKAQNACAGAARRDSPILIELYKSGVLGKKSEENLFDLISCFNELPRESAAGGLLTVWHNMAYGKYVHRNKLDAGKLQILLLLAKNEDNPLALLSRLDELREIILAHRNSPEVSLTLSTIHSSKGLEYDNVYLLDVLDGILPFKAEGELEKDEMRLFQEERRLFYVGVTRARHGLNLFSVAGEASSFVSEAEKLLKGTAMGEKSAPASEKAKTHLVASELNPGDRVKHKFFGPGLVTAIEGSHISVRFDESGETKVFLSGAAPMKKE